MAAETMRMRGRSGAGWWACRASRQRLGGPTLAQCLPGCAKTSLQTRRLGLSQQVLLLSRGPPSSCWRLGVSAGKVVL